MCVIPAKRAREREVESSLVTYSRFYFLYIYVSSFFYFISRILVLLCFATVLFHLIYFMQTHTITLPEHNSPLTGQIHAEHLSIPQKVTELTINNLGSRIITLLGNSRKRTAVIITPGNEGAISNEDIDRMEIAIREPQIHMDTLFGAK